MRKRSKWSIALSSLFILMSSSTAFAYENAPQDNNIQRIVVFGDSLSDTGKMFKKMKGYLPAAPNYYHGRFSNGPVWTDLVGGLLDKRLPMVNEAEGGATAYDYNQESSNPKYDVINNLNYEVKQFEENHQFSPNDLVIIWLGANDYLAYRWNNDNDADRALNAIFSQVGYLSSKGVKHIMLVNVPDLGTSPQARQAGIVNQESHISQYHNQRLQQIASSIYDPNKVKVFDVAEQFKDILSYPQDYGLQDTTSPCFDGGYFWKPFSKRVDRPLNLRARRSTTEALTPAQQRKIAANPVLRYTTAEYVGDFINSYSPSSCQGHLFWDQVHPTKQVHRIIASKMADFINSEFLTN